MTDRSLLSSKPIPDRERLILALDVADEAAARQLVETLGEAVTFYKLGLELFTSGAYFGLVSWLHGLGKRTFADLKLFDVPQTVAAAVRQLRGSGASFVTVHGNDEILEAAVREKGDLGILAVTALTSLDEGDMRDLGFAADLAEVVYSRARRALEIGCDGVISSGLEAERLRRGLGERLLIVTPGIRPGANTADDQKRTVDLEEAFLNGADHVVVGRPIRGAADPRAEAESYQERIRRLFSPD